MNTVAALHDPTVAGDGLTRALHRVPTPTLVARMLKIELGGVLRRCARALGIHRPTALGLEDLAAPDTPLCLDATAFARRAESPLLFNHSLRSYLFGVAVGRHLGIAVDLELLYLAAILHDVGLCPAHAGPGSFEVRGAAVARDYLLAAGLSPGRADRVHEAIARHATVGLADRGPPELALVHFGAGVDVIGYHAEDVHASTREAIVARHPRLAFKRDFGALMEAEARRDPQAHIAGLVGLGFTRRMALAPFAE